MKADVLVIGSGIAGLVFSLTLAKRATVLVITKKGRVESNTNYAQGGIAAVFGQDDSPDLHLQDTLLAGAGLCHADVVDILVQEGPLRVRELIDWGVGFSNEQGRLSLGREGGHSRRRIVRADDLTGREIERALVAAVAESPNIEVLEQHAAVDLLVGGQGSKRRCVGAVVSGPGGDMDLIQARAVLLATGGCGQVFRHTTNPAIATGDGVAMAFRAGARVANLEFIQFHPTALFPADQNTLLISEAVRGEGAVLRRADGSPLLAGEHPLESLAPRDIVARAIDREMKQTGSPYVLLDCSQIAAAEIRSRFPNLLRETAARGSDMLVEPLPVVPAAHYSCGGVATDAHGQSSIGGLFAAGETACTGVHGANRLASNSLLEAVVFAHRAAARVESLLAAPAPETGFAPDVVECTSQPDDALVRGRLRDLMWEEVGITRSDAGLTRAAERIAELEAETLSVEVQNLVDVAKLIVACARIRKESRGLHFNVDHPGRNNEDFLSDTVVQR